MHRVPLSAGAVEVLEQQRAHRTGDFIFPRGQGRLAALEHGVGDGTLRRLKVEVTAHGFRSTFRDWVGERTAFPGDVAEMALAHAIDSKVEAAYRRGDLFQKRVELMEAWTSFAASGLS